MNDGLIGRALSKLEETTGQTLVASDRLELLEAYEQDYRLLNRQLEDIGWTVLDYLGGNPAEITPQARKQIVQQARYIWTRDPQAGAAVELMNDFTFGRGVPRPRCKDKLVQEIVDEAWDDPDNREVLTTLSGQLALGTDLALQSNLFLLMFADGGDGRVKLSILRHDDVTNVIVDPDMRHRALWYAARPSRQEYDFVHDTYKVVRDQIGQKPLYFAHWRNVELLDEEGRKSKVGRPEKSRIGDGVVYHARINRYSEQIMGTPRFQRTIRWYGAYNDFVKARIDIAQAAAAVIMKRKVKGTPSQLARDAAKALNRRSPLAGADAADPNMPMAGPRNASIIEENESVSHEGLKLDTGAGNAQMDAAMIRAPVSAAERFPQSYFGDATNSNLATATSLELPVLKAVESRQEVFEDIFRWFIDRVIERAVDVGRIPLEPDQPAEEEGKTPASLAAQNGKVAFEATLEEAAFDEIVQGRHILELAEVVVCEGERRYVMPLLITRDQDGQTYFRTVEAHEDAVVDEEATTRDLAYEFGMPSPLRRMMSDLIGAITQIAQTFDPNNTNNELSRALLTIALGEGLEVQDPADLVEKILPKGYEDPLIKAQLEQAKQQSQMAMAGASPGFQAFPIGPDGNPYGGPMNSVAPEDQRIQQSLEEGRGDGLVRGRHGKPVPMPKPLKIPPEIKRVAKEVVKAAHEKGKEEGKAEAKSDGGDKGSVEEHFDDLPEHVRRQAEGRRDELEKMFRADVVDVALDMLDEEAGLLSDPDSDNDKRD